MSAPSNLDGHVVALIGRCSPLDRALIVAFAQAGASIAIATQEPTAEQEFAANSIANEAWALGREHLVRVMDATDPAADAAFADEVVDRFGRCDVLVVAHDFPSTAPADELSADEWQASLRLNLTAPFLAAQAFGRVMERQGSGSVVLLVLERADADAAYEAAKAGLAGVARRLGEAWQARGVRVSVARASEADSGAAVSAVLAAVQR